MHYVLIYDYAANYMERRADFRDEHLKLAWESHGRGEFQLGGVMADPVDSALLWFKADSAAVVEDFVAKDPYVKNGLVVSWRIRPWMTVAGTLADAPIHPV